LTTRLGAVRRTTGNASEKLECGANAKIGASLSVALIPIIVTPHVEKHLAHPPADHRAKLLIQPFITE
jgi:hypothetical protein